MSLDEQLAELLANLGVVLEEAPEQAVGRAGAEAGSGTRGAFAYGQRAREEYGQEPVDDDVALDEPAEFSLFQTSREHYGVFYRLDLVAWAPQLRVYLPDEAGVLRLRCYLVRPTPGSPLAAWFHSTREHRGSAAYDDARDAAQQHLLFAAGELMKRLFWTGDVETLRFPDEIVVLRLA